MCAPAAGFSAALLFDCDGVLVETEELHRIAYKCVRRRARLLQPSGRHVAPPTCKQLSCAIRALQHGF